MIQANAKLQNERGVSHFIPITHLNSPTVFETKQGHIGAVLNIDGVAFDTERNSTLNDYHRLWHQALMTLSDEFGVYVTIHRHEIPLTLSGEFPNAFAEQLNHRYHERFSDRAFQNDIYLTLLMKGVTSGKAGKGISFYRKLSNQAVKSSRERYRQQQIKKLSTVISQFKSTLSQFKPRLLGERDEALGYSELLAYLSLMVNGGEPIKLNVAPVMPALTTQFATCKKNHEKYPEGNLAQYLTARRLSFGTAIQFSPYQTASSTFATMLSIKQYGSESAPIMFDKLLHLNTSFISTHAYFVETNTVADKTIIQHRGKMANADDAAVSQLAALDEARDSLASQQLSMGYHQHTLMLLNDSLSELEQQVPQAIKCYQEVGFVPIRETIGQEPLFWSQIPGNQRFMARNSLVTSENFAHFCPLHNYRTGYRDGNHLGECVTILETPSKTPVYFNYHTQGAKQNPSKGHAMIIGGNGAGKTALMCFLDAQAARYQGVTCFFDRDRGAEIYIRASGGGYYRLSPEAKDDIQFAPLRLPDTPQHRKFNLELLALLCKEPDEEYLPTALMAPLKACVDYAYDQLRDEHRTLSHAVSLLPMDFPRWTQLKRWLRDSDGDGEGEYAYLFDNDHDTLSLHQKMGFDMTHFLDHEPSHIRTPVISYILHRITELMNGQLVSIYFDEGWQYLRDRFWEKKFEAWIPTLRKNNAHIVMATQSPESVAQSAINHVFLNNVATAIYFANPQADEKTYREGFKLTSAEYDCIRTNHPHSRLFLMKQEHDATLCKLDLADCQDELFVLSASKASVMALDALRRRLGDNPAAWLPELLASRGLS